MFENLAEFTKMLESRNSFDFDVFKFDQLTKGNCLYHFTYNLFSSLDFFELINEAVFKEFIIQIKEGYSRENSYHNDIHATDVLQSWFAIVDNGKLAQVNLNF